MPTSLSRCVARPDRAAPPPRTRAAWCLAAVAAAGLFLFAPSWGVAGPTGASESGKVAPQKASPTTPPGDGLNVPVRHAEALANAWEKVDRLDASATRRGVVPDFGKRAQAIVKELTTQAGASGTAARHLEQAVDAGLNAIFQRQLHTLVVRSADRYESEVAARPNPLEAAKEAEQAFLESAAALVRPGSGWTFEAAHRDLLAMIADSYDRDAEFVDELAKQGRGKQITIEVIRKLQEQQAIVQREVETRGAFPWNVKWQYMVENSPLGFRGQYMQGRSVVELLLMPSPDPRFKNNILNRIGPLNLAVAFDMLL